MSGNGCWNRRALLISTRLRSTSLLTPPLVLCMYWWVKWAAGQTAGTMTWGEVGGAIGVDEGSA